MKRFRPWPQSLAGQLIALLLIALVVAQVLTLWLFAGERRVALVELARNTIVSRTVSLVRLVEDATETQRPEMLRAISSRFLWFWIDETPALGNTGKGKTDRRIAGMLAEELGAERDIRVDVSHRPPVREAPSRRRIDVGERDGDDDGRAEDDRRRGRDRWRDAPVSLTLSVGLADGRWLNGSSRFRVPRNTLLPVLVAVALMAAAIIAIIALTVRRLTRPLRELAAAADRLGRGEDVEALAETGPLEVRGTIHAFNVMQDRLTRFVRDRTRMLGAISHDLRTPITSLRIRAEFIDDEENREKVIETLDEMQGMVEATLAFARDEASREDAARTDLGGFIDAIAEDYRDMGRPVAFDPPAGRIVVSCRPLSLKRALRNLIDNAVRYGGEAELSLHAGAGSVRIAVADRGPGIPEDRLNDVFEPFVRIEESRSEETGGIGLGLSIARSIVHAHGGTLELVNRPQGGLEARIMLPADRPTRA
ncbi:ATP-binding protein [Stappia sp. MMSF_3263]|uniref:ATP-binding protein n=1 Tax=Stappia sp. MMSF_3263 TaxID=3046693 RepID=UPI00273EB23C|nr:ATP-binding protein [Stappia sp. MMSF_3263]